ncbi:MAG: DUF4142 domain-containing protein [Pyrinomonadaceae bacterium]
MSKQTKSNMLLAAIGLFTLLWSAACATPPESAPNANANDKTGNAAATMPDAKAKPPSDKGDQVVTGGDLAFMNDAAPGSMAEVELGKLAAKQGASKDVKQFGQHMVEDHTKAGKELMSLAEQKKVMLPPDVLPKHKEAMEKLSKLSGADFDREYVKEMVAAHEKDVAAFEGVAMNGTDKDVQGFAAKTLPTLKEHLRMIREINEKMGKK